LVFKSVTFVYTKSSAIALTEVQNLSAALVVDLKQYFIELRHEFYT